MLKNRRKEVVIADSNNQRNFKVGIVIVSKNPDAVANKDEIKRTITDILSPFGGIVLETLIVNDFFEEISENLKDLSDDKGYDVVITAGGTGMSSRDNVPEATKSVINKEVPGFSEAMRMETFKITKRSILSRGVTGIRGKTLIINLPASASGVSECLEVVQEAIPYALDLINENVNKCSDN